MAVSHVTYTVTNVPTQIFAAATGIELARVYVTNHDNAAVFVGDRSVATSGSNLGFTIVKDSNYFFQIDAGESLYAISTTTAQVTVLAFGV